MMLQCDWIETGKTFLAIVCKGFLALCMFGVGGGWRGGGADMMLIKVDREF